MSTARLAAMLSGFLVVLSLMLMPADDKLVLVAAVESAAAGAGVLPLMASTVAGVRSLCRLRDRCDGSRCAVEKFGHMASYAGLTLLVFVLAQRRRLGWVALPLLLGGATEALQHLVVGRMGRLDDVCYNALGVAAGLLLGAAVWWLRRAPRGR